MIQCSPVSSGSPGKSPSREKSCENCGFPTEAQVFYTLIPPFELPQSRAEASK